MIADPKTGKEVTQNFTVQVPDSDVVESTKIVSRRFEVPFEAAKIWTMSGKLLPSAEAQKVLAAPRRCFLYPTSRPPNYQGDPFFAEMLKEDVLVIWYDQEKAKEVPPVAKEIPAEKK